MPRLAHILNVTEITDAKRASYLHVAQPLTMKTMVIAKNRAEQQSIPVELVAIKHRSESVVVPKDFVWAPDIDSYAWEHIAELNNCQQKKPLPRLTDIVSGLHESSAAKYFIYTNLDIGVYPEFYVEVNKLIEKGLDAICINRRTLPKEYQGKRLNEDTMDTIFKLKGTRHPGIDCFIFRREIVSKLRLGNVFVGFPPVGQVLKCQIEDNSENFKWIKHRILTFHVGIDRAWQGKSLYHSTNLSEAKGLYTSCFHKRDGLLWRTWRKLDGLRDW